MNQTSQGKVADGLATRRRKLMWRANHRGMRELDIILGGYAKAKIDTMDEAGLDAFEAVLGLPDPDLFRWLIGLEPVPAARLDATMNDILRFRSSGVARPR